MRIGGRREWHPPPDTAVVNLLDVDRKIMLGEIVLNRLLASRDDMVVINDDISPGRNFWIQSPQRIHGRFIEIPVESDQRKALGGQAVKRLRKVPFYENNSVIEQPVGREIPADNVLRNSQFGTSRQKIKRLVERI